MKRRISLLLAALVASSTFMLLGPAKPASALIMCSGAGTATVFPALLFPVLAGILGRPAKAHDISILIGNQTQVLHSFSVSFATSACAHLRTPPNPPSVIPNPTATGVLKGYCGYLSGTGTLLGEPFVFIGAGKWLIITGHVVGLATALPVPFTTPSCVHAELPPFATESAGFRLATTGATQFLIEGVAVGLNCLNPLPPIQSLITIASTLLLPTQTLGVHITLGGHAWTMSTCVSQPFNHLP